MPEEINRLLTDALSDLLFVSEPSGLENLRREGILYVNGDQIARDEFDQRAVVIRLRGDVAPPLTLTSRAGDVVVYRHRWWFPEAGYRATTWANFWADLGDGSLLKTWALFLWNRGNPAQIASLDGEIYFPR